MAQGQLLLPGVSQLGAIGLRLLQPSWGRRTGSLGRKAGEGALLDHIDPDEHVDGVIAGDALEHAVGGVVSRLPGTHPLGVALCTMCRGSPGVQQALVRVQVPMGTGRGGI